MQKLERETLFLLNLRKLEMNDSSRLCLGLRRLCLGLRRRLGRETNDVGISDWGWGGGCWGGGMLQAVAFAAIVPETQPRAK